MDTGISTLQFFSSSTTFDPLQWRPVATSSSGLRGSCPVAPAPDTSGTTENLPGALQTDSVSLRTAPSTPLPFRVSRLAEEAKITSEMIFSDAAERWVSVFETRRRNTVDGYRQYIRSLNLFFGEMRLLDILDDSLSYITAYQKARFAGAEPFIRYRRPQDAKARRVGDTIIPAKGATPCPEKPKKVNQELGALIRILKRAGLWTEHHSDVYDELIEEIEELPRALTPDEQNLWLTTAKSRERWQIVHWYSLLMLHTAMSTNEIRALRLGDINLSMRSIQIPIEGAKNKHRYRPIDASNPWAAWALEQLLHRADELGSRDPQHYLFPWRISAGAWNESHSTRVGIYDPTRPMSESGIKKAWNEVRAESGITWFRQYDLRHTAITRMAEAGMSSSFIRKQAGHVSQRMQDHYTHLSQQFMSHGMLWVDQVHAMRSGGAIGAHGYGYQTPPMPYNSPASAPNVSYGTNHNAWTNAGAFPVK